MKKTTRKLKFDAETIRSLTSGQLDQVAGGDIGGAITVTGTASAAGANTCRCPTPTQFLTCTDPYVTVLSR